MTDQIAERFALAKTIASEGGKLALRYFNARETLVVEDKVNPQDMASQADREVELLLRKRIAEAFSDDAILGEEGGAHGGESGFTWVLDPIDGTAPYLSGLPHWCVVVAVVQGNETVAGVIAQPMASEVLSARKGTGTWLNGKQVFVGADMKINNFNVGMGINHHAPLPPFVETSGRLFAAGGMFYRNGSGAVMLASVAGGRLGGYYEPHMNPWDCLAGLLMVREAGGQTRPFPPGPVGGIVLAAASSLYDDLARISLT